MSKRKRILCLVLVTLAAWYLAASQTTWLPSGLRLPGPPAPQPAGRDDRWRQDVAYLGAQLPRMHVNAFHTVSREEFERAIVDLEAAVPRLGDVEIVLEIVHIAAMVGDAHTQAIPPASLEHHLYPIAVRWFEDGFYVTGAISAHHDLIGTRLTGIEGVSVEKVVERVTPYVSHETQVGLQDDVRLPMLSPEVLLALGITDRAGIGRVRFEDQSGVTFERELEPLDVDTYFAEVSEPVPVTGDPLYRRSPDVSYWFEYLEDERTLYFQYNRCQEMDEEPFGLFVRRMFALIDARPVERLVVDLRQNGGGDASVLSPFLDTLAERSEWGQERRLLVLVGRGTYSSAALNVVQLRQQTGAVFLGEPLSSLPDHYGESHTFSLPNSQVQVHYATKYMAMSRWMGGEMTIADWLGVLGYTSERFPIDDEPVPFEPDVRVTLTAEDYLAGRDPVLAAALAYGDE